MNKIISTTPLICTALTATACQDVSEGSSKPRQDPIVGNWALESFDKDCSTALLYSYDDETIYYFYQESCLNEMTAHFSIGKDLTGYLYDWNGEIGITYFYDMYESDEYESYPLTFDGTGTVAAEKSASGYDITFDIILDSTFNEESTSDESLIALNCTLTNEKLNCSDDEGTYVFTKE